MAQPQSLNVDWLSKRCIVNNTRVIVTNDERKLGRIAVSTTKLNTGDVVLLEAPIVWGSWDSDLCIECGSPLHHDNTPPPAAAPRPICCNGLQQYHPLLRDHIHEIETELTALKFIGDLDRARVFIKAVNICVTRPYSEECHVFFSLQSDPRPRCSETVMEMKRSPLLNSTIVACMCAMDTSSVRTIIGDDVIAAQGLIAILVGALNINSHQMTDGSALFGLASMLSNACTPAANCCFSASHDHALMITATQPIEAGVVLTIDYGNQVYACIQHRREYFENLYGFHCVCAACTSGIDFPRVFRCTQCGDNEMMPNATMTEWTCTACGRMRLQPEVVQRLVAAEEELLERLETSVQTVTDVDTVSMETDIVHPNHYAFFNLYIAFARLQSASSDSDELQRALLLWERVIEMASRVLPSAHGEWVVYHENYGQVLVALGRIDDAANAFKRAYAMSCLTQTADSVSSVQLKELVEHVPHTVDELLEYYERHKINS